MPKAGRIQGSLGEDFHPSVVLKVARIQLTCRTLTNLDRGSPSVAWLGMCEQRDCDKLSGRVRRQTVPSDIVH